ncbi:hypothetical protein AMK59_1439, partial [Oryctes borbonicus]
MKTAQLLQLFCSCILLYPTAADPTFYWSSYKIGNLLPPNSYQPEKDLYVARILVNGEEIPAGFDYFSRQAVAENNGRKITKNVFSLLCESFPEDLYWKKVNVNSLTEDFLKNAIIGGYQRNITLYIGKVHHGGRWQIGKVFRPKNKLEGLVLPSDDGKSYVAKDFEILMYNYD